jgi:SAM-dependent methyltransferase
MMFGLREEFPYFECARCGCLQIAVIPNDISKYYPENYYSFQILSPARILIKGQYLSDPFTGILALKRFLSLLPGIRFIPEWIRRTQVQTSQSVLELGCGQGAKLLEMRAVGYADLMGVDPFLPHDYTTSSGVALWRKNISDLDRSFDLVMLHHSLEHIPKQLETLLEIKRHLKPDGTVLIRIPLASSFAWKNYGANWVQLDAPRHFYLHTLKSMSILAEQAGFHIANTLYDSTAFQFWGSEQYARDIPLRDPRSFNENKRQSLFSRSALREFDREARRLNKQAQGDQAAFYLKIAPR